MVTMKEVRPDMPGGAHTVWHWLTCEAGIRLHKSQRVFALERNAAGYVSERDWTDVMEWLATHLCGEVDGWTWNHEGRLCTAVWRFRAKQKAEAERFAQQFGAILPRLH